MGYGLNNVILKDYETYKKACVVCAESIVNGIKNGDLTEVEGGFEYSTLFHLKLIKSLFQTLTKEDFEKIFTRRLKLNPK